MAVGMSRVTYDWVVPHICISVAWPSSKTPIPIHPDVLLRKKKYFCLYVNWCFVRVMPHLCICVFDAVKNTNPHTYRYTSSGVMPTSSLSLSLCLSPSMSSLSLSLSLSSSPSLSPCLSPSCWCQQLPRDHSRHNESVNHIDIKICSPFKSTSRMHTRLEWCQQLPRDHCRPSGAQWRSNQYRHQDPYSLKMICHTDIARLEWCQRLAWSHLRHNEGTTKQ